MSRTQSPGGLTDSETAALISRRRGADRPPKVDATGSEIDDSGPIGKPSVAAQRAIRKLLKMPGDDHVRFPRCHCRDWKKARCLDEALGIKIPYGTTQNTSGGYHTRRGHVCSECRCSRTAGAGTRGWWFWTQESGMEEVGHYGVGPCYFHSPQYSTQKDPKITDGYRNRILEEIDTMQQYGMTQTQTGYLVNVRKAAEVAKSRTDTRTALHALKVLADEVIVKLRAHRDSPEALDTMIKDICSLFGLPEDMLSDDEKQSLLQIVEQRPMTETAAGKHIPMSDEKAIRLERDLIKAVGDAAFQSFRSHEEEHMKTDDVVRLIERFYSEAEVQFRTIAGDSVWDRFVVNLKDIGRQLTGMAGQEPEEPRYPGDKFYRKTADKTFGAETVPPEKQKPDTEDTTQEEGK